MVHPLQPLLNYDSTCKTQLDLKELTFAIFWTTQEIKPLCIHVDPFVFAITYTKYNRISFEDGKMPFPT